MLDLCRICLSNNKKSLVDLFTTGFFGYDGENYADQLVYCSGVEVSQGDELPKMICRECIKQVDSACVIKRKCIQTDQMLRQKIKTFVEDPAELPNQDYYVNPMDDDYLADNIDSLLDDRDSCDGDREPLSPVTILVENQPDWHVVLESEVLEAQAIEEQRREVEAAKIDEEFKPEKTIRSRPEDFFCLFCGAIFARVGQKRLHVREEHADEKVCRICNKRKQSVVGTENCMREHQFGSKFLCQLCGRSFHLKAHLDGHVLGVHEAEENPEKVLRCDICGQKFRYKASVSRHMKSHHLGLKIECPQDGCSDKFTTRNSLKFHLYNFHQLPAPVYCDLCGNGYSCPSELQAHTKSSAGRCNNKSFADRVQFQRNKMSRTPFFDKVGGKFFCKVCPKTFDSRRQFGFHFQSSHKGNRVCKVCGKTFNAVANLRRHTRAVHLKIREFQCEFSDCGKAFSSKKILLNHINSHTGEKPYACDMCDFRSGDSSTISKHRKHKH